MGIEFEIPNDKLPILIGHKKVRDYLVFGTKINFTRKARWVLDRHKNISPEGSAYTGVIYRHSAIIAFAHAALNGVDVFVADIRNAHLKY